MTTACPDLTPIPPLRRTQKIYPQQTPTSSAMVRPTLPANVHSQVLKKAIDTVRQEITQNPKSTSNVTLSTFSSEDNVPVPAPRKKQSKKTTASPFQTPSAQVSREVSPDLVPPRRLSPEKSKNSKDSPDAFTAPTRPSSPASSYRQRSPSPVAGTGSAFKSLPSSQYSSQFSHIEVSDDEVEFDDEETEDENQDDVFVTPNARYAPPSRGRASKRPIQLPVGQQITPLRDEDGIIDLTSIDFDRRLVSYLKYFPSLFHRPPPSFFDLARIRSTC